MTMNRPISRRALLHAAATAAAIPAFAADASPPPIIDTHQHLWDLSVLRLPWLDNAPAVLRRNYLPADYREAVAGLNVRKAVYMEVNVEPGQRQTEADWVAALCRKGDTLTAAAVIGGDPADDKLREYLSPYRNGPVKGIRTGLRPQWKDSATVTTNLRLLGEWRMSFDLVCGPAQLPVAVRLVEKCPDTRFILDHCGNGSAKWFLKANRDDGEMRKAREQWLADIARLARLKNVVCKISSVVENAPGLPLEPESFAPVVRHCLTEFGPDRVMFSGNWPVLLRGATLAQWVKLLREIVASDPAAQQRKLFHDNAAMYYALP